jgi:hypothetical protein
VLDAVDVGETGADEVSHGGRAIALASPRPRARADGIAHPLG